jgi:DNA-binding transcriptional ArsR family regulator
MSNMGFPETFKALSDPVRREILTLLKEGKMSAGDIVSSVSAQKSGSCDGDEVQELRVLRAESFGVRGAYVLDFPVQRGTK